MVFQFHKDSNCLFASKQMNFDELCITEFQFHDNVFYYHKAKNYIFYKIYIIVLISPQYVSVCHEALSLNHCSNQILRRKEATKEICI